MGKVWRAQETDVYIDLASNITPTTTNLYGLFSGSTALHGSMRELSITPPELSVEQIDLIGEDANGFQNADKDKKPYGMSTFSAKLIFRGDEDIEPFLYSTVSGATGYTRYQRKTPVEISFVAHVSDGTDERTILVHKADITKLGDLTLNADSYWERDIEGMCLNRDFYEEVKD